MERFQTSFLGWLVLEEDKDGDCEDMALLSQIKVYSFPEEKIELLLCL